MHVCTSLSLSYYPMIITVFQQNMCAVSLAVSLSSSSVSLHPASLCLSKYIACLAIPGPFYCFLWERTIILKIHHYNNEKHKSGEINRIKAREMTKGGGVKF